MPKQQGDIYVEECPECSASFKGLTEKQVKAQLTSHKQSHDEDEEI